MQITVISTEKIVTLNGVPARIWEGETSSGIKVHCYITRIAIDKHETRTDEFQRELSEQIPPSVDIAAIPAALIL